VNRERCLPTLYNGEPTMTPQVVRRKIYPVFVGLFLCSLLFVTHIQTSVYAAKTDSINKSYWISPKEGFVTHGAIHFRAVINIADLDYVPDVKFVGLFENGVIEVEGSLCTGVWKPTQWRLMTCTGHIPSDEKTGAMQVTFVVFTPQGSIKDGIPYYGSKFHNGSFIN
jgi:hypothetical protein